MIAVGFFVSLVLWAILVVASLQVALYLFKEKVLPEKLLLVAPYLIACFLFFGIRYRFAYWFMERQTIHELFGIGSFWEVDRIAFVVCLPIFYAISVLKPDWVIRTYVNIPLLVFLPMVLKLALYFSGVISWEVHPGQMMPTRVE